MPNVPATPDRKPTAEERKQRAALEKVIGKGLATFVEVGNALAAMHTGHLYRWTHRSFADYCEDKWGFSRTRGYELKQAAEIAGELSAVADTPALANEAQARALAAAPKDERADVLKAAADPEGNVTAKAIEAEVKKRRPTPPPVSTPDAEEEYAGSPYGQKPPGFGHAPAPGARVGAPRADPKPVPASGSTTRGERPKTGSPPGQPPGPRGVNEVHVLVDLQPVELGILARDLPAFTVLHRAMTRAVDDLARKVNGKATTKARVPALTAPAPSSDCDCAKSKEKVLPHGVYCHPSLGGCNRRKR